MQTPRWLIAVTVIMAGVTLGIPMALHVSGHVCSLTTFNDECGPSGWASIILGDIVIAATLVTLMHKMGRRTDEQITSTINKIEEMVKRKKGLKDRRITFVCRTLKNAFETILISAGLMDMQLKDEKDVDTARSRIQPELDAMNTAVRNGYDVADMAVEALDPDLVGNIYRLLDRLDAINPETGAGSGFPEYEEISGNIRIFTESLDEQMKSIAESTGAPQ